MLVGLVGLGDQQWVGVLDGQVVLKIVSIEMSETLGLDWNFRVNESTLVFLDNGIDACRNLLSVEVEWVHVLVSWDLVCVPFLLCELRLENMGVGVPREVQLIRTDADAVEPGNFWILVAWIWG